RSLERVENVDVESRCKLDDRANQRLPRLTVTARVGVWSDNRPGAPDQGDRQRQSNDEAQPSPRCSSLRHAQLHRSRVISGVIAFASVLLHSQGRLRPSLSPFWHNLTEPGDYKRERNPRRGTYVVLRWVANSITTSLPTVGSDFPPIKIVAID